MAPLGLQVHPSNQHVWATAGAEGELAVWDLRLAKQPMAHKLPEKHRADIWEVSSRLPTHRHFDSQTSLQSASFLTPFDPANSVPPAP